MEEKGKSEERLSREEEYRIDQKIRMSAILLAVCILAYLIYCMMKKVQIGIVYYVIVIAFCAVYWTMSDLVSLKLKRGFAGRSERQKSAYKKMAALDLIGDIGLGVFLVGINEQYSLVGAGVFLIGVVYGRKFRTEYEKEDGERSGGPGSRAAGEGQTGTPLPSAADRVQRKTAAEKIEELNRAAAEAEEVPEDASGEQKD